MAFITVVVELYSSQAMLHMFAFIISSTYLANLERLYDQTQFVVNTRDGSTGKFHIAAAGGHNTREVLSPP